MLQRPEDGREEVNVRLHGWVIGVELEEGRDPNIVSLRLADALTFVEGTGNVSVEYLGEVSFAPEPEGEV